MSRGEMIVYAIRQSTQKLNTIHSVVIFYNIFQNQLSIAYLLFEKKM